MTVSIRDAVELDQSALVTGDYFCLVLDIAGTEERLNFVVEPYVLPEEATYSMVAFLEVSTHTATVRSAWRELGHNAANLRLRLDGPVRIGEMIQLGHTLERKPFNRPPFDGARVIRIEQLQLTGISSTKS